MNRYSRIFHHITTEDVKRKRRENIKVQEIKDELERERLEAIVEPVQHVDWRDDLKELAGFEWVVTSNGPTNSASTKFTGQYHGANTGNTFTANGLGGSDVLPTSITVNIEGDSVSVDPPTYSQFPVAGLPMPVSAAMWREKNEQKAQDINKRLSASQEFAKKVKADKFMGARVTEKELSKMDPFEKAKLVKKRIKEVDKWKSEMKNYDKKLVAWSKTRDYYLSLRKDKVNKFLTKYKVKIDNVKWSPTPESSTTKWESYTVSNGKLIIIKSNGVFWNEGTKISTEVYSNYKQKGNQFYDISGLDESDEFKAKELPIPQKPEPPEFMKKNLDKGWQPVTGFGDQGQSGILSSDEGYLARFKAAFTISLSGAKFPAQLALRLASGDLTPVTKSPGPVISNIIKKNIAKVLEIGKTEEKLFPNGDVDNQHSFWNPEKGSGAVRYNVYGGFSVGMAPVSASMGQYSIQRTDKGIRIQDIYDISGGFTAPGGAAMFDPVVKAMQFADNEPSDVQSAGEKITAIAARRGAELGFDMSDPDTGKGLKPVYSGEEEYNSRNFPVDPNAPKIATPKGFNIPIDFTIPWNQLPPETAKLLQSKGEKKGEVPPAPKKVEKKKEGRLAAYGGDQPIVRDKKKKVVATESKALSKIKNQFSYKGQPSPDGFPDAPPPKLKNGWHPGYGKKDNMYNRLDPISAKSMPKTGDPTIDKKVEKAKKKNKA